MARLIWSPQAREDLRNIRRYISRDSRRHANIFVRRLIAAGESLELFPTSGRVVPGDRHGEHRELIVQGYRIIYHVTDDVVEIDTVVHGARRLPELPEP